METLVARSIRSRAPHYLVGLHLRGHGKVEKAHMLRGANSNSEHVLKMTQMPTPKLAPLVIAALIVSTIGFAIPWTMWSVNESIVSLKVTVAVELVALAVCLALNVVAILSHGKRALWVLLASAPIVFWPTWFIVIEVACFLSPDCYD
jgi:hypothetical protein